MTGVQTCALPIYVATGIQYKRPFTGSFAPTGSTLQVTKINMAMANTLVALAGPAQRTYISLSTSWFAVTKISAVASYSVTSDLAQPGETACGAATYLASPGTPGAPLFADGIDCQQANMMMKWFLSTGSLGTGFPGWTCNGVQDGLVYCTRGANVSEPLTSWTAATEHVRSVPAGGAKVPTT